MIYQLSEIVRILFQRVSVERLLEPKQEALYYDELNVDYLQDLMLTYHQQFSDTEMRLRISEVKTQMKSHTTIRPYLNGLNVKDDMLNVFSVLFYYVTDVLVFHENRVVCRYDRLLEWKRLSDYIGEDLPVTAMLALKDCEQGTENRDFCWQPVLNHNNTQLNRILAKGMAENHFHLRCAAPYFHISWINLMNHPGRRDISKFLDNLGGAVRDKQRKSEGSAIYQTVSSLVILAALIRLYLSSCLSSRQIKLQPYRIPPMEIWSEVRKSKKSSQFMIDFRASLDQLQKNTETTFGAVLDEMETQHNGKCGYSELMSFFRLFSSVTFDRQKISDETDIEDIANEVTEHITYLELEKCRHCLPPQVFSMYWRRETWQTVQRMLHRPVQLEMNVVKLQEILDNLQHITGEMDYMLQFSPDIHRDSEEEYRVLGGERWFEYRMLKCILSGDRLFNRQEINLFYAYLRIKNEVRSELVQVNDMVGFENFQIYQDRKDWFSHTGDHLISEGMLARMAVRGVLSNPAVKYLEARISPAKSAYENALTIQSYDRAITRESDQKKEFIKDIKEVRNNFKGHASNCAIPEDDLRRRFYYVFHFPKKADSQDGWFFTEYRHYEFRRNLKEKAEEILKFRQDYPELAQRVLGIDACAQEIGCRPEVFARAFRVLKKYVSPFISQGCNEELPQLKITYHVGEDFLDITDGLRAIEEAVRFLQLDCGDRLGHALALGINAEEWYQFKGYHITLPLHDYLDNVVWLHHALTKYKVNGTDVLKSWLEKEFSHYFTYIYQNSILYAVVNNSPIERHTEGTFDINVYYLSWLLRGDHPSLYKSGRYVEAKGKADPWQRYSANEEKMRNDDIRKIPEVAFLYYMYHYDRHVRERGSEVKTKCIPDIYVEGVIQVQKAIRERLVERGIAIETNPSSNFYISTFREYGEHPIKTFYNLGLTKNEQELMECPQMNVSINTDDNGVFSTRLEIEYALLARAMEGDNSGISESKGYKREFIYQWLDNIREMGLRQSFIAVEND